MRDPLLWLGQAIVVAKFDISAEAAGAEEAARQLELLQNLAKLYGADEFTAHGICLILQALKRRRGGRRDCERSTRGPARLLLREQVHDETVEFKATYRPCWGSKRSHARRAELQKNGNQDE